MNGTTLVMFMHGVPGAGGMVRGVFGILHSLGRNPPINTRLMMTAPAWDDRVLPIGWHTRNRNQHYTAFTRAVRGWGQVDQLHLYGCQLAQATDIAGLIDLTQDVGKEVWAYTGFTYTGARSCSIIHSRANRTTNNGVSRRGGGYHQVSLATNRGTLPGWQMRGYMAGGQPAVDVFDPAALGGPIVETYTRQSLRQQPLPGPASTSRVIVPRAAPAPAPAP